MTNTKSTPPRRRRNPKHNCRAARTTRENIVKHMLAAEDDLPALAEAADLSLSELIEWARDPEHIQLLRALSDLADTSCQMLINRYRAAAAGRLFELTGKQDDKALETARKACVDLLRSNLHPPDKPLNRPSKSTFDSPNDNDSTSDIRQLAAPPSESAILNALEQLGDNLQ